MVPPDDGSQGLPQRFKDQRTLTRDRILSGHIAFGGSHMRLDCQKTVGRDRDGVDPRLDQQPGEGRVVTGRLSA